jgi:hypothetical protein
MKPDGMTKTNLKWTTALAATTVAVSLLWWGAEAFTSQANAQIPQTGVVEGFEATEYYPEPNHTNLMVRIKAEKVNPHPGSRLLLSAMHLQVFLTNGTPAFSVQAPECIYDFTVGTASSTGRLQMASGDGRFSVEGEGFEWRQKGMTLNISNRVHTILRDVMTKKKKAKR